MDGKNCSGRRISLLNDNPEPLLHHHHHVRLPSITPSLRSRTSSYASSPVASPPTPQLVRSDSTDSTAMQTPSPITPEFTFDRLPQQSLPSPIFNQSSFFPSQKELSSAYPPVPQPTGPLPYHATTPHQAGYFRSQQPAETRSTASTNPRSKKNSYPCPVAKQYNCTDHFTTSGHAARHAKKHTGKKDAFCPECNKAFTRKDNMEQHRRTHQTGRNAAKGGDTNVKKVKQQAKRPRPAPLQSSVSSMSLMDPNLPVSPTSSYMAPTVQSTESFADFAQPSPYPDPTTFGMGRSLSQYSNYGLDALAIAASGENRKFDC